MTAEPGRIRLLAALDAWHARGKVARLWLRDDDAVEPTDALSRFLSIAGNAGVPATLAVIPEHSGPELAAWLQRWPEVTVALHGWSHRNHAPPTEKKQELGAHRPVEVVLDELRRGFDKLGVLHRPRFIPMLVPPWNRISPALLPELKAVGLTCLSVFGPEKPGPLAMLNTHVDVMDWHGTRGGRDSDVLLGEVAARLETMGDGGTMGLLTHHLVHDRAVDDFLQVLFAMTIRHPGCCWVGAADLMRTL